MFVFMTYFSTEESDKVRVSIKAERYLTMAGYMGDIATLEKPFKRDAFLELVRKQIAPE